MQIRIWFIHPSEIVLDLEDDMSLTEEEWNEMGVGDKGNEIESAIKEYFDYGYEEIRE
jgi:hypothetical protein